MLRRILVLFGIFLSPLPSYAGAVITYHGRIIDNYGQPLQSSNVTFHIRVYSPNPGKCLLYEEIRSLNMSNSGGVFVIPIGDGAGTRTAADPGVVMDKIFSNNSSLNFMSVDNPKIICNSGAGYQPQPLDQRQLFVSFDDHSGSGIQTLPPMDVNYVPLAFNANDAQNIGGTPAGSVLRVDGGYAAPLTTAYFTELMNLITGTSTQYEKVGKLNGQTLPTLTNGQVLGWNGGWTAVTPLTSFSETDPSVKSFAKINLPACTGTSFLQNDGSGNFACASVSGSPSGAAGGDLGNTYPNPTVLKIQGQPVDSTPPATGQVMLWDTTTWKPQYVRMQDIRNSWGGTQMIPATACTANESMVWSVITDRFACQAIGSLDATKITSGTLAVANGGTGSASFTANRLVSTGAAGTALTNFNCPQGQMIQFDGSGNVGCDTISNILGYTPANGTSYVAKTGDTMTGVLNLPADGLIVGTSQLVTNNGRVGIGTASPSGILDVKGGVAASGNGTNITLRAQDGSSTGNTDGGSIWLMPGNAHGTGAFGSVYIYPTLTGAVARFQPSSSTANTMMYFTSNNGFAAIDATNGVAAPLALNPGGGNVGIGTTSPGAKLEVNGQIKITGGTPGAGKVLTSDAAGLAAWSPISIAPAGTNGQLQFNDSGAMGGANGTFWNKTTNSLALSTNYSGSSSAGPLSSSLTYTATAAGGGVGASYMPSITVFGTGGPQVLAGIYSSLNIASGSITSQYTAAGLFSAGTSNGSHTNLYGIRSDATIMSSSASVTNLYAGSFGSFSSGPITNGYGIEMNGLSSTSGITNGYGLYIGTVNATNAWSIYSANAANSYFNGRVGIGTTTPGYKLDVSGDIRIASGSKLYVGTTATCDSTGCTASPSDIRYKENITPLVGSLDNILKIQGVSYDWIDKKSFNDKHQIGFIAQDLEKIYPEVVKTDEKTGFKSVMYDKLVAPVIEAVKILYSRLQNVEHQQSLQSRDIASVKSSMNSKFTTLEEENKKLKQENTVQAQQLNAMKMYLCAKDPNWTGCK